jgi:EmrB/QacA subfamily drug resistance transporter
MGALMLTLFLEALDQTVVGTAMPRIIAKLHGFDRYTWAVTAYLLASTVMVPIAGKLSDQFGRKAFLLGGTSLFLAGSALCGVSETINQLIVCRAVQGLGAGIGISLVFASVADIFPPDRSARWQGTLGSVYGVASIIGPTLGGWLTDHGPLLGSLVTSDARWRWVFFVNLPLGVAALAVLLINLPSNVSARTGEPTGWSLVRRVDFLGAAVLAAATVLLLVGLTWVGEGEDTWGSARVDLALAAAGILYLTFGLIERSAAEPILSPGLLRNRTFAADAALTLFLWMTLFGTAFYVPLFLQGVLGTSPTMAGATMTPFSMSIVAGNFLAGLAISFLKRYQAVAVLGTVVMTAGETLLWRMTPTTPPVHVAALMFLAGFGSGVLFTATAVVVQRSLPSSQLGAGFGAMRYVGQIGGMLGVAIVGTVVNGSLVSELHRRLSSVAARQLAAAGVRFTSGPQALISPTYRHALITAALRRAAAHAPPGPHHATAVAAQTVELQHLNGFFATLKLSLAAAVQHGLLAALLFSCSAILAALFVSDVPLQAQSSEEAGEASTELRGAAS